MSILFQLFGSVAAWWGSWRHAVADDQEKRRKVKTIEDRLEGCELVGTWAYYDETNEVLVRKCAYKAPDAGITLMVTKEYRL